MRAAQSDLSKVTLVITKLTTKLTTLVNLPFRGGTKVVIEHSKDGKYLRY